MTQFVTRSSSKPGDANIISTIAAIPPKQADAAPKCWEKVWLLVLGYMNLSSAPGRLHELWKRLKKHCSRVSLTPKTTTQYLTTTRTPPVQTLPVEWRVFVVGPHVCHHGGGWGVGVWGVGGGHGVEAVQGRKSWQGDATGRRHAQAKGVQARHLLCEVKVRLLGLVTLSWVREG